MTLINFGIALVIFLVLKPWRFFEWLDLSWLPDDEPHERRDWVCRNEVNEAGAAVCSSDGRLILD
jgi:hypothetical protein